MKLVKGTTFSIISPGLKYLGLWKVGKRQKLKLKSIFFLSFISILNIHTSRKFLDIIVEL